MATRRHDEAIGSEKVTIATGRSREEWFALLDAAGAVAWPHKQIAEWLVTEHDVDGWWAQSLTVGFEQARGLRQPGQRPDGTFDANVSRTFARSAADVFTHLDDDAAREGWLTGWTVAGSTAPKRLRLTDGSDSRVLVEIAEVSAEKVRVAVQHMKLPDPAAVQEQKAYWKAALGRLADRLAR